MALSGAELLDYACLKFQEEKYDEALEAFVLAYMKGYEQQWIIENIYSCYMEGNEKEFRNAFQRYAGKTNIAFENCLLDFIPYRDGEYYIFDKELKKFWGVYSMPELRQTAPDPIFSQMEFSAAVMEFEWNWNERKSVLVEAENRKIYVVTHDIKRCISFCKIPELASYWKNIRLYSERSSLQMFFHKHTSVYLPQLVFGMEMEQEALTRILSEEHAYRLTPEGRNTENILLTIAIPTCNRGNLVLKRLENLLTMLYDAEIEIAISKNGMELYQEEYEKVGKITDARVNYYDHGKLLKITENWQYVVEMSHGRYVLYVSDEDDVVLPSLEHFLKLLTDYPQVNLIRAKSTFQYSLIIERKYKKKGLDAFENAFLYQGYLAGLIVRRKDFLEEHFEYLEQFSENEFYKYYPHECWCALLSQKGDYMEEPVILIHEGETAFKKKDDMEEERQTLPFYATYATYKARLKQFTGIVEFIHWMMKNDQMKMAVGLWRAIEKTGYLFGMARGYGYDQEHFVEWVECFCQQAMEAIDEFQLSEPYNTQLLIELKNTCDNILAEHEKLSAQT